MAPYCLQLWRRHVNGEIAWVWEKKRRLIQFFFKRQITEGTNGEMSFTLFMTKK